MRITRPVIREIFTLERKTKSNIPNINGITYTEEAFEDAMKEYVKRDGGLYLAPYSINDNYYGKEITRKVNNSIYVKFHYPTPKLEYRVADIIEWDNKYMTFKCNATDTSSPFIEKIGEDTKVALRYIADSETKIVEKMKIVLLDIGVISFDELGIDIDKYIKEVS